jgi:chromosome segregation ATPase
MKDELEAALDARTADRDAAYRQALSSVRDRLRTVAERTRVQLPALEAAQRGMLRFADETDRLAGQIASLGDTWVGQTLANLAADIRTPFHGAARSGFGGGVAPIEESRTHLRLFDDARAMLADVNARRTTIEQFRAALGRIDGHLRRAQDLRGAVERLKQDYRNADPSPAAARIAPAVTRDERPAGIPVVTDFEPGR